MHDHARRLVDDDDRRVLMDDVERQLLCLDAGLFAAAAPRPWRLRRRSRCRAGPRRETVHLDGALLDPALDARARVLRQQRGPAPGPGACRRIQGGTRRDGSGTWGATVWSDGWFGPLYFTRPATISNSKHRQTRDDRPSMRAMRTAGILALLILVLGIAVTRLQDPRGPRRPMTDPAGGL